MATPKLALNTRLVITSDHSLAEGNTSLNQPLSNVETNVQKKIGILVTRNIVKMDYEGDEMVISCLNEVTPCEKRRTVPILNGYTSICHKNYEKFFAKDTLPWNEDSVFEPSSCEQVEAAYYTNTIAGNLNSSTIVEENNIRYGKQPGKTFLFDQQVLVRQQQDSFQMAKKLIENISDTDQLRALARVLENAERKIATETNTPRTPKKSVTVKTIRGIEYFYENWGENGKVVGRSLGRTLPADYDLSTVKLSEKAKRKAGLV